MCQGQYEQYMFAYKINITIRKEVTFILTLIEKLFDIQSVYIDIINYLRNWEIDIQLGLTLVCEFT